jgi:hypothetical protein
MDEWLERVVYSASATSEAQDFRAKVMLSSPPSPRVKVTATLGGAVEVLGWDASVKQAAPGKPFNVTVYVRATGPAKEPWRFEVAAESTDASGAPQVTRQEIVPVNGLYPTTRWKAGDLLKLEFSLKAPPGWKSGDAALRLRALDEKRQDVPAAGAVAPDGRGVALGPLPVGVSG